MKHLSVHDTYSHEFHFTQEQVILFAQASGDHNPIHLDENYASTTIFKRPIVHGFLAGSVFSKVFGTLWPGEGTIYLKQSMQFLWPMYVEETYLASFTVVELYGEKQRALIKTEILSQNQKTLLSGEALIQHHTITPILASYC